MGADVVAFIFREEVYKPDDPDLEGKAELIIAKQRNGPTGVAKLAFIKRSTRFENLTHESGGGEYLRMACIFRQSDEVNGDLGCGCQHDV